MLKELRDSGMLSNAQFRKMHISEPLARFLQVWKLLTFQRYLKLFQFGAGIYREARGISLTQSYLAKLYVSTWDISTEQSNLFCVWSQSQKWLNGGGWKCQNPNPETQNQVGKKPQKTSLGTHQAWAVFSPSGYIWKSYKQMRSVCAQAQLHDKQQHCDFCLFHMAPAMVIARCPCAWIPLVPFFKAKWTPNHSFFILQGTSCISFSCFYRTPLITEFSHSVALWEGTGRKNSLCSLYLLNFRSTEVRLCQLYTTMLQHPGSIFSLHWDGGSNLTQLFWLTDKMPGSYWWCSESEQSCYVATSMQHFST